MFVVYRRSAGEQAVSCTCVSGLQCNPYCTDGVRGKTSQFPSEWYQTSWRGISRALV